MSAQQNTDLNAGHSWEREAHELTARGLYDPAQEHDADGKPQRRIVEAGIEALKAVWHRGAVDADGRTGDGAGIHVEIPQDFFRDQVAGPETITGDMAVGMVFLPRTDLPAQERCRVLVEREILNYGYKIHGWRQVPVNTSVIGEKAENTRPEIEQIMIANTRGTAPDLFEIDLYIIRRRIERAAEGESIKDFYICSLSGRSIIYKGMFLAEQLDAFYPDLRDPRFVSRFAIFHQRYSTNTFPTWRLAQPFRVLAHNGEINTLSGNVNWMKTHESRIDAAAFTGAIEDLKPVIQPGASDSAALDAVFELEARAGRSLPMVKTMMIPEAWHADSPIPQAHKDLYSYCNTVMEPWDGPAAVCAYDGRWALAGLDRNGLRPLRYTLTGDGLLFAGSETGMVRLPEEEIVEKGRLGPGQMIAVDLAEGRLYHDRELKDMLAAERPFGEWVKNVTEIVQIREPEHHEKARLEKADLRRRQLSFGWNMEDLELILHPMVELAKEAIGSMGDDTPLAVLSDRYRGLHHFFRQNFSQVTNPPIDSLRERQVMTLVTRLGNLGNILDEDEGQLEIIQLASPMLTNGEYAALRNHMGDAAAEIDCTFDADADEGALQAALRRIRKEAENAVRGGCNHVILNDLALDETKAPIPMILATGAVHTHLLQQNLRTFTSLIVRSGECMDVHYFAVLVGVGATAVNAYLAQESLAERHNQGLFEDMSLDTAVARFKTAVEDGLLKVMSKMGISVVSSYRGGFNFEAVGLSRTLGRILPRHAKPYFRHRFERHPDQGHRTAPAGLFRRLCGFASGWLLPLSPGRRAPRLGSEYDPHAADRGRQRFLFHLQEVQPSGGQPSAKPAA
jgi:glutamate synthase (NADPH/NADH) large chain